jgi:predicted DNA-binding transcriptional regulator AlpA
MNETDSKPKMVSIVQRHDAQRDVLQSVVDSLLDSLAEKIVERLQQVDSGRAQQGENRLLDSAEAAEILGLSKHWLYKNSNRLPFAIKVGGALRFERRGLERWLEMRRK